MKCSMTLEPYAIYFLLLVFMTDSSASLILPIHSSVKITSYARCIPSW